MKKKKSRLEKGIAWLIEFTCEHRIILSDKEVREFISLLGKNYDEVS